MCDHAYALSHTNRMWWLCSVCLPGTFPNLPLSLSSLSGPLPAAAGAAGGRHNLRRLLSLNHRDPSSRHPPPSPPSHQHGHSTFTHRHFKQVVFKYSDRYDTIVCTVWKCTNRCGLYVPVPTLYILDLLKTAKGKNNFENQKQEKINLSVRNIV